MRVQMPAAWPAAMRVFVVFELDGYRDDASVAHTAFGNDVIGEMLSDTRGPRRGLSERHHGWRSSSGRAAPFG